ncbi:porin [Pseudomonas putida]|uniref:porin n=1 Tax=Pseudomonas putida TaxID=303 RepID=UPI00236332AD|nr:porin [Pseudomonas putida]MDD2068663.1 porin [Pseudomonas putida]
MAVFAGKACAAGFPGLAMTAAGWGPLVTDKGYASKVQVYGTLDAYVDTYDSGGRSGTRFAGGGVWTNKIGVFARLGLSEDTALVADIEEGFNFDGDALSHNSTWQDVGRLRLAMVGVRSKQWGSLDLGKSFGVTAPTMLDPFYGPAKLSPHTSLSAPVATPGANYADIRPKHSIVYTTPRWHNWSIASALTFNFDEAAHSGRTVRGQAVRLDYFSPEVIFLAGIGRYWSNPYETADGKVQTANDYYFLNYSYDFGPISLSAAWQRQTIDTAIAPHLDVFTAGATMPVGKDLVRAVLVNRKVEGKDNDAWGGMVGYDHFFTPQTAVYARLGLVVNQRRAGQTMAAIPLDNADDTPQDLAIGMYHHF